MDGFIRGLLDDPNDPQVAQYNPQAGWDTAKDWAKTLYGMTTPGGVQDAAGLLGGPSIRENVGSGNYGDAALQAFGVLPGVGVAKGLLGGAHLAAVLAPAAKVSKAAKAAEEIASPAVAKSVAGFDPAELATRYPERLPGKPMIDAKTGKDYIGKDPSPEAEAVMKVRANAQKDINAGRYDPYFNVNERYYVDPNNYPLEGNTIIDAAPKKQKTIDEWTAKYNNEATRGRVENAINKSIDDPNAWHWYAVGQLEKKYIDTLGEEAGRAAFKKDFAQGMAATTGGMDPTSNLLMTHYANFMRQNGQPLPSAAYDLHSPIGGRYATGNLAQYDKMINQGQGITATDNPKRFDFSGAFLGHKDKATMDEQMMELIHPKSEGGKGLPQWYSPATQTVHDVAGKIGMDPINAQELAWFGQKGVAGKPMIQILNEGLERTRRVTGLSPDEILKGLVTKKIPLYGLAAGGLLGASGQSNVSDGSTL